jgi:lysophospholipase
MTTVFDPVRARAALIPLDWARPPAPAGTLRDYVRFYGLDFGGRIAKLAHGLGCIEACGYRIAVQQFRIPAARGTVLVVHGYYDHVGIYDHLIGHLLAQGWNVVAFDLPGHGLSGGDEAAIDSFDEYQVVLRAVLRGIVAAGLPAPLHAVGQSTGGAILMDYLAHLQHGEAPAFARAAVLAPLVRPVHWPANRALYYLLSPLRTYIGRKFAANSHDEDFLRFLRDRDPLQARRLSVRWVGAMKDWIPRMESAPASDFPLAVVQGDEDGTVDWRHNLPVVRAKFPRATVTLVGTGRHQLVNEAPALRAQVFAAIDAAFANQTTAD